MPYISSSFVINTSTVSDIVRMKGRINRLQQERNNVSEARFSTVALLSIRLACCDDQLMLIAHAGARVFQPIRNEYSCFFKPAEHAICKTCISDLPCLCLAPLCLCLCLPLSLSLSLFLCLSVSACLSLCLSAYLFLSLSMSACLFLSLRLSLSPHLCLPVSLLVSASLCLCLSVFPPHLSVWCFCMFGNLSECLYFLYNFKRAC